MILIAAATKNLNENWQHICSSMHIPNGLKAFVINYFCKRVLELHVEIERTQEKKKKQICTRFLARKCYRIESSAKQLATTHDLVKYRSI